MKNEKCIKCDKIGVSCAGPNFMAMSSQEVVEWCQARKKHLKIPRGQLAEETGTPLGTLNRFFTGKNEFFYFETARNIIKVLVGGDNGVDSCQSIAGQLEHENELLKRENEDLKSIITTALSSKF